MHLARRAVDANAVGKIVPQKAIARCPPEFRAGIGAVGEIIVLDQVLIRIDEVKAIPDTVCLGIARTTLCRVCSNKSPPRGGSSPQPCFGL